MMSKTERIDQIKITLPLIALCLPLFAKHYVIAENGCPYETYLHVDNKCVDISEQGLSEITESLDTDAVHEVNQEIEEVGQQLADLSAELAEFCVTKQPETTAQIEIIENICQY
ncbi:MAG: hypothetical protein AAGF83_24755 [Cyanobacteria bacterium P01_G01_bin.67]